LTKTFLTRYGDAIKAKLKKRIAIKLHPVLGLISSAGELVGAAHSTFGETLQKTLHFKFKNQRIWLYNG